MSRNAVGRVVSAELVEKYGGDKDVTYRQAMQVVGMGHGNAVPIAQRTNESILELSGGFKMCNRLIYKTPLPVADLLEGVYIDDVCVIHKCVYKYNRCKKGEIERK